MVVDRPKIDSLFFQLGEGALGQLWVVAVWDLRGQGNKLRVSLVEISTENTSISPKDSDVLVCLIPSTYLGMHSLLHQDQQSCFKALMWQSTTSVSAKV